MGTNGVQQKRLFLLDAYALIYRAYYAFLKNPRYNSKGVNTSAVLGFVNTLEEVLRREQPSHIAVVFDPSGPTFRHEAFAEYKANREASPEDIRTSVPIIKEIVDSYRIPVIQVEGFEADDVIGTLALLASEKGFDVFMMTPDKDYGQLVNERRFIYKPKFAGNDFEILGIDEVIKKFDIQSPSQVIDWLALTGDQADNIPGCPNIGPKKASLLLKEFDSIDRLLENTHQLKGSLKQTIEEHKEQILFSRFLATIKTDVPLEWNEQQLIREELDKERLAAIFSELEFRTLLSKLNEAHPSGAFKSEETLSLAVHQADLFETLGAHAPEVLQLSGSGHLQTAQTVPHRYEAIQTDEQRSWLLDQLLEQRSVCFDTETDSLEAVSARLVGLSFSWKAHEAYYLPIPEDQHEAQKIVQRFLPFFNDDQIEKIGQNMKFDLLVLSNYGVEVKGPLFDTMIAHYLLQPELRHNMDYLAEIFLSYKTIHIDELIGKRSPQQRSMRSVELAVITEYASEDADITFQLKQILAPKINEAHMEELFYNMEMPLMKVLTIMERNGVLIDDFALKQSSEILTADLVHLEQEIYQLANFRFNISSSKQVGEVLFERLQIIDKPKKTKTGQYSTGEEVLEALKGKHPVVDKILEYRGLKKLLNTYIDALPTLINRKTGKIHTSFNQTVTATGRLSSSNPNLQNIPVRDAQGKEIRKAFIPEPGCLFLAADYSQIELRIMAHLSQDRTMIEAFLSGEDIHAATAAKIFKVPLEQVTNEMRRKAKTANFGIIYGISVFGLSERLNVPRSEAKELIDQYFATYPGVKQYMDHCIEEARKNGWVETLFKRKRFLPDINSQNANVRGFAERNAINAPIQGTAADIIKLAMIRIQHRFSEAAVRSSMILQVHDELDFNVYPDELSVVQQWIVEEMEHVVPLLVPLKVETGIGANWLEAH
ncbi:MAG: DNA polymerase I [Microbacter sp.]